MRSPTEDTTAFLEFLDQFAEKLSISLGRSAEVVVHDFRRADGTIVAIHGNLTDRSIGGSMSRIGLELIAAGDSAQDKHNYVTTTSNGRTLKASTFALRDFHGKVFGAFCINVDVTDIRRAASVISELAGAEIPEPAPIVFSDDLVEVVRSIIAQEVLQIGVPVDRFTRKDREKLIRALDERGIFTMQNAVPITAEALSVSRTTVYNCLNSIR